MPSRVVDTCADANGSANGTLVDAIRSAHATRRDGIRWEGVATRRPDFDPRLGRVAVGWHVTMRLADDRVIASAPAALRRASRVLVARGASCGLLAFCVADTHVHAAVACSEKSAREFGRAVEHSLRLVLRIAVPFERARLREVRDVFHLHNTVGYVLRQGRHHGTAHDPAYDGCSVLDLLGLRVIDSGVFERLRVAVPRITRASAAPWFPDLAATEPRVDFLPSAAAAAVAAPDLAANRPEVVLARRAAVHVGAPLVGLAITAELLRIARPAARRHLAAPVSGALARAVRGQLALQTLAASQRASTLSDDEPFPDW